MTQRLKRTKTTPRLCNIRIDGGGTGIKPQAVKGAWYGHEPGDVSGTVNQADNLDTIHDFPVKDEIRPNRKIAQLGRNVGSFRAKTGLIPEKNEGLFDVIEYAVGGAHIVLGDVKLEVDQVFLGLRCALDPRHHPPRTCCRAFLLSSEPPPGFGLDRRHVNKRFASGTLMLETGDKLFSGVNSDFQWLDLTAWLPDLEQWLPDLGEVRPDPNALPHPKPPTPDRRRESGCADRYSRR